MSLRWCLRCVLSYELYMISRHNMNDHWIAFTLHDMCRVERLVLHKKYSAFYLKGWDSSTLFS